MIFVPSAPPTMSLVIPGIQIPGSPVFIPFWYGILALFCVVVIHEFGHGIVARANGIKIQQTKKDRAVKLADGTIAYSNGLVNVRADYISTVRENGNVMQERLPYVIVGFAQCTFFLVCCYRSSGN